MKCKEPLSITFILTMIEKLQFITTTVALAEQACSGGVRWVQLRLKNVSHEAYKTEALKVQQVCKHYGAKLIIDDNVELALEIKADGIHIGKEDMPLNEARALLGNDFIIGCTANTMEDIIAIAAQSQADYIGLGPYRFTVTKKKLSPILGLEGYQDIFNSLKQKNIVIPPVIGIGGIEAEDIPALFQTGLYGVAVSGAIANEKDIQGTAQKFVDLCAA
ncbi:thiamine phosphate synthase [Danxiaibacter flavus]|uniref:Thiamine-phosphate synthase n=1 Tax=Danxiaibacter flavus TaxID=3049108 RepID=A0ABV3ZL62_9BACT|nr:thiamine phosphate synthase [Chitinophagaceae bacterium DXS]